jgi:aspartyl-tRNA(Asn)/glutamyl-tRNA(Gln) amidotransferase subunit B
MALKADIGLEVHVQLKTQSKMFCGCSTSFAAPPNSHVCPVCLGYPGALPVANAEAVKLIVMTGLMIGSKINLFSKWDRKSYFYPDMPKNYQLTQYDQPFCVGGQVEFAMGDRTKTVRINRIHLEEDVAKNVHLASSSGVDFNRAGTPLMEIVTEPDMESADEAFAFLQALKQILLYGGVSDCNLEQGNLRCDINCSVRPVGSDTLGVKAEIKNMNTFKGVHRALKYEIARQMKEVDRGGAIVQETRRWDDDAGMTESMRSKEYAHDYRYLPDPDLVPVVLEEAQVASWRSALPELPAARRQRFVESYGLPDYDAGVLVADKLLADFFETVAKESGNAKAASNWVMTEMLRYLKETEVELAAVKVSPRALASLIKLVDGKAINMPAAKEVFAELFANGGEPEAIVKAKGLAQVSDTGAIEKFVDEAIAANAKSVADLKAGKQAALQFLIGQVMRLSKGKANPGMVKEMVERKVLER